MHGRARPIACVCDIKVISLHPGCLLVGARIGT
jgi:hypothetical protein